MPDPEPMPGRIARLRQHVAERLATARGLGLPAPGLSIVVSLDALAALFAELDVLRAELDAMRALVEKGGNELRDAVIERNDARAELAEARRTPEAETVSGTDPRYLEYLRQQREQGPPPGPPQS